ncbi:PTS system mannose/fructose/N-acetylgalactosamine-transporter subunit IIB [Thermoanaerobacterium thermosaccharolyticum]|uniref:PTS system mannose/fructose/N-acetylgalactosamine-transporter subunit IIB n=1 Tax=Thermoanaerobacterium thermosaccharolyticum TaxID=1517 RepID=UPI001238BB39|nr:PTS sugar transporter subunit IIB [Thermoanaerobacterium thermosaccharolyticum]KAA5806028.1 PTS sugar transporter subunit IIB [Thermoanaerobacterium thermosaccharolyticum]
MGIIHIRVDDRLVHGLVATMWANYVGATRLMVVDDVTSENQLIKSSLKIATPAGINLSVLSVERAATNILSGKYDNQRVMIIVKTPVVLWQLYEKGVKFNSVNMGNITYTEDKIKVAKTVSVSPNDVEAIRKLSEHGVKFTSQLITSDPAEDFLELMRKAGIEI